MSTHDDLLPNLGRMAVDDQIDPRDRDVIRQAHVRIRRLTDECAAAEARAETAETALAAAHDVIAAGLVAFQLTREYVGEDVLPAIEGWSWHDWTKRAEAALRDVPDQPNPTDTTEDARPAARLHRRITGHNLALISAAASNCAECDWSWPNEPTNLDDEGDR